MESADSRIHYSSNSKYRCIDKVWKRYKKGTCSSYGHRTKKPFCMGRSMSWIIALVQYSEKNKVPASIMLLLTGRGSLGNSLCRSDPTDDPTDDPTEYTGAYSVDYPYLFHPRLNQLSINNYQLTIINYELKNDSSGWNLSFWAVKNYYLHSCASMHILDPYSIHKYFIFDRVRFSW